MVSGLEIIWCTDFVNFIRNLLRCCWVGYIPYSFSRRAIDAL